MTVQPNLPPTNTLSDGTTTTFPYNFKVLREEHLKATFTVIATGVVTDLEIESYTGIGDDAGGTVTFATAPADDGIVTTDSIAPLSQIEEFNGNKLPPETVERGLDSVAIQNQRQQSQIERSVRFPPSDSQIPTLPAQAQRAGKIVAFDATGAEFELVDGAQASQAAVDQAREQADRAVAAAEYPYTTASTKTVNFMPIQADDLTLFRVDSTGGAITVTLDEIANLSAGYNIGIYRVPDGETVTVQGSNGDLINGQASIDIDSDYLVLDFTHDGSEWIAADKSIIGLPVGTAANNIVALTSEAKLPAVDGSLLTNIEDQIARDMGASALAFIVAQSDAVAVAGSIGPFKLSDNFQSDSLATKTGATYDAANDWYANPETTAQISQGTGTAIGSMTGESGLAAAFDGQTSETYANSAVAFPSASGYANTIGKNWGTAKSVNKAIYYGPTDNPILATGATTIKLQAWDGSAWIDVSTEKSTTASTSAVITIEGEITDTTAYTQHRFNVSGNGTNGIACAEAEFFETIASPNMTLRPTATTITTGAQTILSYFLFDPVDSVTLETDINCKVSIDGYSTLATAELESLGEIGSTGKTLVRALADVSAQTGTSLGYSIETANNKSLRFTDFVGAVPIY
ncbi:hypothetical protein [Thalassospira xiamenensis]|uniref:hypothetical protein n=1 Tax=Thalassospira xiamenensis TaxID=220697 RepID=UPI003AA88581